MENIAALIAEAKAGGRSGALAIDELKSMGARAAPAIVEEIRRSPLNQIKLLSDILEEQSCDPEILPILIPLLEDDSPPVKLASHQALRRMKDPRAVQPLLDILLGGTQLEITKGLAARTLGTLNDNRSITGLQTAASNLFGGPPTPFGMQWAAKEEDEDKLRLAIEIAMALAKLGDHEMHSVITRIIFTHCSKEKIQDSTICSEAVAALAYVVGPEMVRALRLAVLSQDAEVRLQAVDPLRYLGTREAVGWLIEVAEDETENVAESAFTSIHDITGEWPNGNEDVGRLGAGQLREWWSSTQNKFTSGVCYRLGKPMNLSVLIELLNHPAQKNRVLAELLLITGNDFQRYSWEETKKWYTQNRGHFRPGCLYKFGHEQDLGMLT